MFIEFDVVLDRPFPTERVVEFEIKNGELCSSSEGVDDVYKHISPSTLKQIVKTLEVGKPCFKVGTIIIRRK